MLSVSMSADGWTTVTPAPDTHIIYVSSSAGSDANNGLSPTAPVQTIARGVSLLRDGSADWMLLKCGDTWNTGLGIWRKSGRSDQEPLFIGSYGTGARPLLETGTSSGLWACASSSPEVDHLVVEGLHFYANGRDPNSPDYAGPSDTIGIDILTKTEGFTLEDCQIEDYAININLQSYFGPITNASIRRNIIDNAYATTTHSQGLYAFSVTNLLIEGNTFDHNGYNTDVPGGQPTYYNHDCYISRSNTGVVIRDNIFARAAAYGLQDRPGGIVEDNLFIDDPIGMSFGLVNGASSTPGGVTGVVNGNVFVGGGDLVGQPFGQGIVIGNTAPGYPTVISNNIFADGLPKALAAISLAYGQGITNAQDAVGINDLNIQSNIIYDWYRGIFVEGGMTPGAVGLQALNDVSISGNDLQDVPGPAVQTQDPVDSAAVQFSDNAYGDGSTSMLVGSSSVTLARWMAQDEKSAAQAALPFIDPARTLSLYDASSGGAGSNADFLAHAADQSQQSWQEPYTAEAVIAYFQGGFDNAASPRDWAAPTPPVVSAVSFPSTVMAKDTALTFTVTYLDADQPIDPASLASGNLTVKAPGFTAAAQFISSSSSGNQTQATYSIAAPQGMFHAGRRYTLQLMVNSGQVRDMQGFAVLAGRVGTFILRVLPRPNPPTVQSVTLIGHGQAIAVRFSEDVSASLNVADLLLQSDQGEAIDPSLMSVSWNAAKRTATWSFPGEVGGVLPAGRWHLRISAATLVDSIGQPLDGNRNRTGGDDFVLRRVLERR
jgi:hypothetical protein